jgi:purine-nucleoside phosphorylase
MDALTPSLLEATARSFAERHRIPRLRAALVAGSGISLRPPGWEKQAEVPYTEVFPFAIRDLLGHTTTVSLYGRGEEGLLIFNGRFHPYQGYSSSEVASIPRLAGLLGAGVYIATNAAGSMDPRVEPGSLVVIADHINLQGSNPLVGDWAAWRDPMFPDMTHAYDPELRRLAMRHAATAGFAVHEGVYAGVLGPSYETPAEIEMLRRLGAVAVGMSTVQEVVAARHMGMRVLVISLVTNLAAGIAGRPLTHQEVLDAGAAARERLATLLERLLGEITGDGG